MLGSIGQIITGRAAYTQASNPLGRRIRRLSALERREEARAFLTTFHDATAAGRAARQKRWAEVRRSLSRHGHYEHTPEELAFGARLAWRNHGRCIGRLFWESLEVLDCRSITAPEAISAQMFDHMAKALGDGRIRSMISIFAPVCGANLPAYIESPQITQYAGYVRGDGTILGDRQNVELTRTLQSLGWRPPSAPGMFDLLPLLVRGADDRRAFFPIPRESIREVDIQHPDYPELAEAKLRWYAVPCVSGMVLTIGGIDYPCAPFNGFYMGTEIASRNLVDAGRYDLLPRIARQFRLDPDAGGVPLWRDTALTELNRAVLHSFQAAGVTMVDHHAASDQFMEFHRREQAQGRRVAGDWRWIVPPQASAGCEVFHLRMKNFHPVPNFYTSGSDDGRQLMPFYGDRHQTRVERALDRLRRRWKLWKRMAW